VTLTQSKLHDLAAASPLIAFYAWGVWRDVPTFLGVAHVLTRDGLTTLTLVQALSVLASVGFGALLVGLLVLRMPPVGKAHGISPRVAAVAGTFAVLGFSFLPRAGMSPMASTGATALALSGTLLTAYSLLVLGRSFSIVPEARRLVTSGPYRFVRHPVYAFEEVAVLGIAAQHVQPASAALLLVHFAFQLTRMHYEERVLASTFPEYQAYAARTARLIPGIY
jgi:protein-S-isoprenylcysteine O-methyltransferase Ste14